ncbi:hypothetical protein Tco_0481306 [Tanacetum coccineum]
MKLKASRKDKFMFYSRFTKGVFNSLLVQGSLASKEESIKSEALKDFNAFAMEKVSPKPKYVRRTTKEKTVQAPKVSSGKRIKSVVKVTKSRKKKQLAQGLETLSEIALSEAEQMKLVIERSKTQLHSSQPGGSGTHEGTGVTPRVPDVPTYRSDDEEISWKSSDEDDDNDDNQDDDDERTESDNEGDDFVHPKFTTHDSRLRTVETNVQPTQETEDTHVIITAPVNPEGQQQSSSVSSGFVSNMLNLVQNKKTVNEQLEAEVLTRLSNKYKTSHAVATNLFELELKNILIDKMERNKRRDDEDKDEEPSTGSNRGSKRRRARKEPESTSAPKEKTSKTTGKSTEWSKSHYKSAGESAQAEEPMHTAKDLEEPIHQEFKIGVTGDQPNEETYQTLPEAHEPVQPWLSSLAQIEDPRESFNELMDTPLDFSAFKHCHSKACGRSSIRCQKLPKEAQPHKAGYHKDKKSRLMRIDELHKFSDGTLNDVWIAFDDHLKGIQMKYLPQTIWRQSDRDKAGAMIQAIDKQLKTRRIMRSLEKFVGGRPYEGDFRLLQRTI